MKLSFSKLTPEIRAIRKLFLFAEVDVELNPFDRELPELEVEDCVLVGWKTVLVFAGRLSHKLSSDPLAAAVVMQWIDVESPGDDALHDDVERLLRLVEVEFEKHNGDFLCDHTLNRSSAADFLWRERLLHIKATWGVDAETYPRTTTFLECDPALDVRDDEEDQSDDERPETPEGTLPGTLPGHPPSCAIA